MATKILHAGFREQNTHIDHVPGVGLAAQNYLEDLSIAMAPGHLEKRWPSNVESDDWEFLKGVYIAHKLAGNTTIENIKVQIHSGEMFSS
ncbi:hypothetical protein MMC31_006621 [Peltigera leucophlebia]|nr:hypothetical protein [Peltigera leucophlebia]